jgi:hypothetical protein
MTETHPHVVYGKTDTRAVVCGSYAEAHRQWKHWHTHENPFVISPLGNRVIDPSTEVVDVGE